MVLYLEILRLSPTLNLGSFLFDESSLYQHNNHFDVLDDAVDKYNNTVHRTINSSMDSVIIFINNII